MKNSITERIKTLKTKYINEEETNIRNSNRTTEKPTYLNDYLTDSEIALNAACSSNPCISRGSENKIWIPSPLKS